MARAILKKDFKDGDKLYGQQLNNNFGTIEAALDAMNKIVWQDDVDESMTAFRGTTEQIQNQPIIDGQLLYDISTGETYIDYNGERISTGSGNSIHIGADTPENDATQLWIDPTDTVTNIGTEVVNNLDGDETYMAPSVHAIKSANAYSTSEINTGKKWVDNKPIYRKVIQTTKANIESAINALNIDTPIYFYGLADSKYGFTWEANTYYSDEAGYSNWYHWSQTTPRQISWQFQTYFENNNNVLAILEYTKTTDGSDS